MFDKSDNESPQPLKHQRRKRYSGKHPKRFEQKYKELYIEDYPEIKDHLIKKGRTPAGTHIPVMVNEIIDCLKPKSGEIVVDCTVGYGGHASEFIKLIGPSGKLIALDVDKTELERTRERLSNANVPVSFHQSNFAGIAKVLKKETIDGCDIIFADLGVSSMQIDNPLRGMSYKNKGPLDMRMDDRLKRTAADLLNSLSEKELSDALWKLADETDHHKIALRIVEQRKQKAIIQTSQLVDLVFEVKGINKKIWRQQRRTSKLASLHPAARTFQALRILVNDELNCLRELLRTAPYCLNQGGRIGIISFHSGEDRIVQKAFEEGLKNGIYQSASEDAVVPTSGEIYSNPRSASAKFRWAVIKSLQK